MSAFGSIALWILRHSAELPAVIPLLKDAADSGGVEETVDDAIALLQWFKPLAHDFPDDGAVMTLSAADDATIQGLFNGDGTKLARLIAMLQAAWELYKKFRP